MVYINRRRFLSTGASLGMMGAGGALGILNNQQAFAADTSGYKALVCLFMHGGMDHADLLLPYDQASYDQLYAQRGSLMDAYSNKGTSRQRTDFTPLNVRNSSSLGGRQFSLPPEMTEAQALFDSGELSIVAGVGPLIEPTSRSQMEANGVELPARLYSHNDQQSTWKALNTEGAREGWGGKFIASAYDSSPNESAQFMAITTSSTDVFLSSEQVSQFRVDSNGVPDLELLSRQSRLGRGDAYDAARADLKEHLRGQNLSSDNLYMQDVIAAGGMAIDSADTMRQALTVAPTISTEFPNSRLGRQLGVVSQTIAIQQALNVSRQIFFVGIGGFDTHSSQSSALPSLFRDMSQSIAAFRLALQEINMWNNVTLFTASEFGRTVIDNGDGTDHGWGSHQLVLGGALEGGNIYGDVADFDVDGERYTKSRGRLIPSVSVEQYAATMGQWFGLDQMELRAALPNLDNFDNPILSSLV